MSDVTLLLVDDVADNITALRALIESSFAARILTANSGIDALKILLHEKVDLILSDVQMPEMDGFELASMLKRKPSSRNIPIIFITAIFDSAEFRKKGYDLGAIDYITKPIDPILLISRLKIYLHLFGVQNQLLANAKQLHELNDSLEQKVQSRTLELQRSEARFREMFEQHHAMMLLVDFSDGAILDANPSACRFYGYSTDELKEMSIHELDKGYQAVDESGAASSSFRERTAFELEHRLSNGDSRTVEVYSSPVNFDDRPVLFWIIHDISERKFAEQRVNHLAFYDPLTQLPNRRLFEDRLSHAMMASSRTNSYAALMFIDLDNFKNLNDTQGHDIGDILLIEVSNRLKLCVRNSDTVARFGGDEFTVLLEALDTEETSSAHSANLIAEKIRSVLAEPYNLLDHVHRTTPSIGVVLFQSTDETAMDLCKHADAAMYQAKAAGRNTIRFYNPDMQEELELRAGLEADLRNALERKEFMLYYQIQVKNSQPAIGAEALLRWIHPERGFVSPAQFIPLAEEIGLIYPIGLWVLRTACEQIKEWSKNLTTQRLTISVNVSAHQFQHAGFVKHVKQAITLNGINPARLKLELTESVFLRDASRCIEIMHELKKIGVSLSMDDFGTGYSSLNYLKQLPLDELKIDQSFVRDLGYDDNDAAIVKAIITLGQVFGLNVIAEGVETDTQHEFLHLNGCYNYQGYLFSKPVPAEEFIKLIESNSVNTKILRKVG